MSATPNLATLVLSSTFVFVLLVILLAKAPKAGAFVVSLLLMVLPLSMLLGHESWGVGLPIFTIWAAFLFVLLVVLLVRQPKVGAALIVALVLLGAFALFLRPLASHRRVARMETRADAPWASVKVSSSPGYRTVPPVAEDREVFSALPPAALRQEPAAVSPIWSEGVEQEFEADVYPSSLAAAKALGRRMAEPIRTVAGDPNAALKVVLFQENNERSLVTGFGHALEKELPGVRYSIEADLRNIHPGEVGLTLRLDTEPQWIALAEGATVKLSNPRDNTRIVATAFAEGRRASAEARFIDKPWVENFAAFTSARPEQHFIVTRSQGTCTSDSEAHQQALDDARARLKDALGQRPEWQRLGLPEPAITTTDVLQGGFEADRFTQSFDGSASKVWREALLIDVSGPKLTRLADQKARELRALRMSWARMGFSVLGVLVLIGVIYSFLNMATRGYYEWSLRIAGVVLAILAIISVLMVVQ
jgi:hypothetical protein